MQVESATQKNETRKETLIGSPNWISLYIHEGKEPTRRDDYIALVYIFMDLCMQTIESGLPWMDTTPGFHFIDTPMNTNMLQQKDWKCLKTMIDKSILKEEEKTLFQKIIFLCSRLSFCDKPPYDQIWFDF